MTIGNVTKMKIENIGKLDLNIRNKENQDNTLTLVNVSYIPTFWTNLLSITTAINQYESKLGNRGNIMTLTIPKDGITIEFWKIFPSQHGFLGGLDVTSRHRKIKESAYIMKMEK